MEENILFDEDMAENNRQIPRRRRAGNIRWLLILIFLLACGVGGYFLAQSELFHIHEVTVTGNKELSRDDVLRLTGIETGEHIYSVNLSQAELLLSTSYWVSSSEIHRRLPDKIEIKITERVPLASVQSDRGILIIDAKGMILRSQKLLSGLDLVTISGVDDAASSGFEVGTYIDSTKLQTGLYVIERMSTEAASVISELNVSETQRIIASTVYGVDMRMGDCKNFLAKYNTFMQVLEQEDAKGNISRVDYIDVSVPDMPALKYNKTTTDNAGKKTDG